MSTTWLKDNRTNSFSYITEMDVKSYLNLVEAAYEERGGIEGQRDPLKTTTARRIRNRMLEDLAEGAVIPPIVVGISVDKSTFEGLPPSKDVRVADFFPKKSMDAIAIIDGMQRTTALKEASERYPEVLNKTLRVEFWVANKVNSLIYRMLVLNTGQVPWTLSRQLEVVYKSLIEDLESNVDEIGRIIRESDGGRRVKGAEYKASILVELYLSFSSRKTSIDTKQAVSEQFAQLDFVENLSRSEFQTQFYKAIGYMSQIDEIFSRVENVHNVEGLSRFKKGRNIFDTNPARIGFIVAFAQYVIGRAGTERSSEEQNSKMDEIETRLNGFINKIKALKPEELGEFLSLDVLEQVLLVRSGKVGDFERSVFEKAFSVLIAEHTNLSSMEPCWRAH